MSEHLLEVKHLKNHIRCMIILKIICKEEICVRSMICLSLLKKEKLTDW